jgi:hypothetical protein
LAVLKTTIPFTDTYPIKNSRMKRLLSFAILSTKKQAKQHPKNMNKKSNIINMSRRGDSYGIQSPPETMVSAKQWHHLLARNVPFDIWLENFETMSAECGDGFRIESRVDGDHYFSLLLALCGMAKHSSCPTIYAMAAIGEALSEKRKESDLTQTLGMRRTPKIGPVAKL